MSYLVLACAGLDKAEGSISREIALRLAEEADAQIVCPVALNRTPARYTKAFSEARLVVVDGCATQCAAKLAMTAGVKPEHRVVISDAVRQSGVTLAPDLRLGPDALEFARRIADEIAARQVAREAGIVAGGAAEVADTVMVADATSFEQSSESVVVVHDKYEFRIPATGYLFNANDVWVQVAGSRARIGISDYMQQRLTDITYVDPPELGTTIEQFDEAGTVESTKASFELVSPVSGTVVGVNEAVTDAPDSINEDPYGSWIVELEMSDWESDRGLLVDGPAYAAEVERKAAEDS